MQHASPPLCRSRQNWHAVLASALLAWVLLSACSTPRGARAVPASPAPAPPPSPYLRIASGTNETTALEVACRAFRPHRGPGPVVWLIGVTHLGTADYYTRLQRFLDAQDLVLFEGVGAADGRFELSSKGEFHLQEALARALGLRFQLAEINYQRPHFRNSDLTLNELQRALAGDHADRLEPAKGGGPSAFGTLLDALQGSGLAGGLARLGVTVIGASPRLQAATKLAMIEVLGVASTNLASLPGLPPAFQRLMEVLIENRNIHVVHDVHAALSEGAPPLSIAVFYGAGHMHDLEMRLRKALPNHVLAREEWFTAFAVSPGESGMSQFELHLVRTYLRTHLRTLFPTQP